VVVNGLLQYGLARMYAAYAASARKDPDSLQTLVFRSFEEALGWIKENEKKA
jgi:hypothetical protein